MPNMTLSSSHRLRPLSVISLGVRQLLPSSTEQWPTEQTRAKVERTSAIPTTSVDGTFLNHITARSIHSIRSAAAFSPAAALHRLSHGPGAPILMIRLSARETDRGRPFFRGQVTCVRVIPVSADFAWRLCGNERMY